MCLTKASLKKQLEVLGINKKGTLLVHSSMKSLGEVEGGAETVLDALSEYMAEGLLVFPTHTWAYINGENPRFYEERSEVCIGILPELFRKREGVVRSLHPTHSVAAYGKGVKSFIEGHELWDTPCARQSPWGRLLDQEAQILLIGVDLRRNTFIHGVEEWMDIPGRLTEAPEQLYVITKEGQTISVPSRRHYGDHWSEYFGKVDALFEEKGVMKKGQLGAAEVRLCETKPMTALLKILLKQNPSLFSNAAAFEKERYLEI